MKTLTRIRGGRTSEWLVLVFDDDESLSVPATVFFTRSMGVGDVVGSAILEELRAEAESARVRAAAVHLIGFRVRSRREIEMRLRQKGFASESIEAAVEWLQEKGHLDDEAFAVAFVRDRIRFRPRGRRALLAELSGKGVRGDLAEGAIARALEVEEVSFDVLALGVGRKWMRARSGRQEAGPGDPRLRAHLARKGFAPDAIRFALDTLRDETDRVRET